MFSCNGSIFTSIPAVTQDFGTLVGLEISLQEGTGQTFISLNPPIGVTTQKSIQIAVSNAFSSSNQEQGTCDVSLVFYAPPVAQLDGPSAGASIAAHTYSLINNMEIDKKTIITGAIDENGFVIPVGGVYEKALIALENNLTTIITPPLTIPEKTILSKLKTDYNFTLVEVLVLSDILDYALYGKEVKETLFEINLEILPEIEEYPFKTDEDLQDFYPLVEKTIIYQEESMQNIPKPQGFESLANYFQSVLNNTKTLSEKGYYFTAANRGFLYYIDISTIVNGQNLNIENKKIEVEECLNSLPKINKTTENFQWVISSELREYWAKNKLNSLNLDKPLLEEEKYIIFNDLMYADGWCKISTNLREIAATKSKGSKIDESLWKDYAQQLLSDAYSVPEDPNSDTHLRTANMLFEDGKYGAAIFDSLYVLKLTNPHTSDNLTEEELNSSIKSMSNILPTSIWGKIYHTQGYYLSQENISDFSTAYDIYSYSSSLDEATSTMLSLVGEEKEEEINLEVILFTYLVVILLLLGLLILIYNSNRFFGP